MRLYKKFEVKFFLILLYKKLLVGKLKKLHNELLILQDKVRRKIKIKNRFWFK